MHGYAIKIVDLDATFALALSTIEVSTAIRTKKKRIRGNEIHPVSKAVRIVSRPSRSPVPPYIRLDQVPNPMRDTSRFKPFTVAYSMVLALRKSSSQ
jgi:hypothetical protein